MLSQQWARGMGSTSGRVKDKSEIAQVAATFPKRSLGAAWDSLALQFGC